MKSANLPVDSCEPIDGSSLISAVNKGKERSIKLDLCLASHERKSFVSQRRALQCSSSFMARHLIPVNDLLQEIALNLIVFLSFITIKMQSLGDRPGLIQRSDGFHRGSLFHHQLSSRPFHAGHNPL